MVAIAVTKAITNRQEAHQKLGIAPAASNNFFHEWRGQLPELTITEIANLDRFKQRYVEYADNGSIAKGTVNLILLSPLFDLLGLLDSPYQIRGEKYVRFELEDGETRLDGPIDALVVQENLCARKSLASRD